MLSHKSGARQIGLFGAHRHSNWQHICLCHSLLLAPWENNNIFVTPNIQCQNNASLHCWLLHVLSLLICLGFRGAIMRPTCMLFTATNTTVWSLYFCCYLCLCLQFSGGGATGQHQPPPSNQRWSQPGQTWGYFLLSCHLVQEWLHRTLHRW